MAQQTAKNCPHCGKFMMSAEEIDTATHESVTVWSCPDGMTPPIVEN